MKNLTQEQYKEQQLRWEKERELYEEHWEQEFNELKEKPVINDGEKIYFAANEHIYAINVNTDEPDEYTLHNADDGVYHEQVPAHELAFDVEQDCDNETTTFIFDKFKIVWSGNDVSYA